MAANIRLVLNSGPTAGKEYPLEKPELFIGRDLGNDVVINDSEVSRRHARLYLQGNTYIIEDLGSTNGTSVNGQKLTGPYMLRAGERITFGERINLSVEEVAKTPPAPAVNISFQQPPVVQPPTAPKPPAYQAPVTPPPQQVYTPPVQSAPQSYPQPQQQYPFQTAYPQQQTYPPQQQSYAPQPVVRPGQPFYPAPMPQASDLMDQGPYSGQVPAPSYTEEPIIQYRIPIWMFVLIGVLLLTIVILLIDDFHLWCPLFGIC